MSLAIVRMVSTKGVVHATWLVMCPFEGPSVIDMGSPMILEIIKRVKDREDFHPEWYPKKAALQVEFVEFDANFTQVIA